MGRASKVKKSSLWTTTFEDIDKSSLPTEKDIQKVLDHIKDNNIDINKQVPEVEKLKKIFEPKS